MKKAFIIEGFVIEDLLIICKRDGNAHAYIESELLRLIDLSNDLHSFIKLYKIQLFVRNTFNIKKEEAPLFYSHIIDLLKDIGQFNKSMADASSALSYFLLRLKEEKIVFRGFKSLANITYYLCCYNDVKVLFFCYTYFCKGIL